MRFLIALMLVAVIVPAYLCQDSSSSDEQPSAGKIFEKIIQRIGNLH